MPGFLKQYGPEVQHVSNDTPLEDICQLLKRDGVVIIKKLIPLEEVEKAHEEIEERLQKDVVWEGTFFPSK